MKLTKEKCVLTFLRLGMGWIFLWPFLDKLFGLGFTTATDKSWLLGVSPTTGFLQFATKGPFAILFQGLAGNVVIDWLFMLGLFLISLALISGIGIKIASYSGTLLFFLMWMAVLPPEHNPILDEHIIYGAVLISFNFIKSNQWLGLGNWWSKTKLVKKYHFLE